MSGRFVLLLLAAGSLVWAEDSVGKQFGTREPFVCKSRREPAKGSLSSSQAAEYFKCRFEKRDDKHLSLAENVKVEVGKGRPFQGSDHLLQDIDPGSLLYPIRGSYDWYYCGKLGMLYNTLGKNCTYTPQPNATGVCYRTTFGDWTCLLSDTQNGSTGSQENVPGPK